MVYNVNPEEMEPVVTNHINGSTEETLARYCITELCKGWPVYRDASEWKNYRSLFAEKGAHVWTTWSGALSIEKFIEVSISGRKRGDFIMHRENGTLANVNLAKGRGIGKMKATITQRFVLDGIPCDIECDCRFIFFAFQDENKEWKAQYVKLFYEKDKVIAVDGKNAPYFPPEELAKYTEGYQYLGAAQYKLGHTILSGLPNANNEGWYKLYESMAAWLQGEDVDLFTEKSAVENKDLATFKS